MSGSFLKNKRGFSLVELMVVVAIIGILASIAIPSIGRYMAKARQTEAKTNLSSLYTAEKAFIAEYNTYTGGFQVIGYTPEGNLRYNVGFTGEGVACTTLNTYGYAQTCPATINTNTRTYCTGTCTQLADANPTLPAPTAVPTLMPTVTATPTNNAFTAVASGKIRNQSGAAVYDTWQIDERKALVNQRDGSQ